MYDEKCYELAKYFYPEASEDKLDDLAQQIQDIIEDFDPDYEEPEDENYEEDENEPEAPEPRPEPEKK